MMVVPGPQPGQDSPLDRSRPSRRRLRRQRILVVVAFGAALAVVGGLSFQALGGGDRHPILVPRATVPEDVLAFSESQVADLERAASFGASHPLYVKSPGGVLASAKRTAAFRPLVEQAVEGSGFDADLVEAIVFLESGGRPEVIAGDDPAGASGLTQILAETAQNFLGMEVDLAASRRLTTAIAAAERRGDGAAAERLRARRRGIDARFDPEQALAGTVRYLTTARERFGREDLAVVSYHMGIGNLEAVLRDYVYAGHGVPVSELVEQHDLSWARVFFDTSPSRNIAAHERLGRLGDDSPTYYWRVLAAEEIMRLYRDDPSRLAELESLYRAKASAEEVLHPPAETERFEDASDLERAWTDRTLQPLPDDPASLGFSVDETMGELAPKLGRPEDLYRGLRPEALAALVYLSGRVRALSGAEQPLQVTSTVRDEPYQQLLRTTNAEATRGYSLHTTGYAFDIRRRYESAAQARALQFELEDLAARGLIAWVREPGAIHITVSSEAESLVSLVLERSR